MNFCFIIGKNRFYGGGEMFNNINVTVLEKNHSFCLSLPVEDYFFTYGSLNYDNARDLVRNYFEMKSIDGEPRVINTEIDTQSNTVKVSVDVDYNISENRDSYTVPDLWSSEGFISRAEGQ